jgi:hypothetical protein
MAAEEGEAEVGEVEEDKVEEGKEVEGKEGEGEAEGGESEVVKNKVRIMINGEALLARKKLRQQRSNLSKIPWTSQASR